MPVGPERQETTRLICERLHPDHAAEMSQLLLDPRVARTLWPWPVPQTEADVRSGLASKIDHWERHGFGLWLLRDRSTGTIVGRGGLQHTYAAGLDRVEVAWAIMPARWGQGLATELALTAVEVGFRDLELNEVVALTLPDNIASRRVMEKAGFSYERDIEYVDLPHMLYRRLAD